MSRVGKKPVSVPAGVKVVIADRNITVEGPLGRLEQSFSPEVSVVFDATVATIVVSRTMESRTAAAMHGLYRALIQNMVIGVTKGYEENLEIFGTGYLFAVQGKVLQVRAGFANEIQRPIPEGLAVKCPDQQHVNIKGINKQMVGEFAASVRAIRRAEPYLGKGIKYAKGGMKYKDGEVIRRKESKAATKK